VTRGHPEVVVCGHICLDVIPTFAEGGASWEELLTPGKLSNVGPAVVSTGGVVSNTGLALHRLGIKTRLMAKIGEDLLGRVVVEVLRRHGPALASGMLISSDAPTSYTIVLNPPGVDRIFLHCPGANDTFGASDVPFPELAGVRLFHFGYPPLMRRMFINDGQELETLCRRAKAQGPVTCLDMAWPDPAAESGQAPWERILARVLPHVDIFLPSLDEILFMLDRPRLEQMEARGGINGQAEADLLNGLAGRLLDMGTAVVVLKLGDQGLYLRTGADPARVAALAGLTEPGAWVDRELLAPCFLANAVGTTGAGDCAVAGFLAGLVHGLTPEEVLTSAVAVGACNVEAADATSGVPSWQEVQARVAAGWERRPVSLPLAGWEWDEATGLWRSEADRAHHA